LTIRRLQLIPRSRRTGMGARSSSNRSNDTCQGGRLMPTTLPIDPLIDAERGIISREIFVSPEQYRAELEKLFTRAWLFVGHESLIPNPGDFFTSRMGEESVILCRDKAGAIH